MQLSTFIELKPSKTVTIIPKPVFNSNIIFQTNCLLNPYTPTIHRITEAFSGKEHQDNYQLACDNVPCTFLFITQFNLFL